MDITTTTVLRPEILRATFASFTENLFGSMDDHRLIINIDPVGEDCSYTKVLDVCNSFFKNVVWNCPKEPSFTNAVRWVWSQVSQEKDIFFHLEDDWRLTRKVDINQLINTLRSDKTAATLRLSKYQVPAVGPFRLARSSYDYIGNGYWRIIGSNRFGLSPVLIRSKFVRKALPLMVEDLNPESQFRIFVNKELDSLTKKWTYLLYGPRGSDRMIVDTGRVWRKAYGFERSPGLYFLKWNKQT